MTFPSNAFKKKMKPSLFLAIASLVVMTGLTSLKAADDVPASFLRSYSLDERTPYQIPVTLHRGMTTLVFPEPPQNFAAARIAFIEPGKTVPDFAKDDRIDFILLAHRGSTTCSIRAVRPEAQDTLSVFLGGKVYQLFLRADEAQPLLTVEFHLRPNVATAQTAAVSSNQLIDCLTRAKAYSILRKYYPDELDGVTHVTSHRLIDYPDFRVQISDIFRFDAADTLVFHVLLQNETNREIPYQRSELCVRVGPADGSFSDASSGQANLRGAPSLYDASVVDASGIMPPKSVTSAWFAITGTRQGGRNELDPARNLFTVLVPRTDFPAITTPTSTGKPSLDPKVISF
jgi:hypothetical protein